MEAPLKKSMKKNIFLYFLKIEAYFFLYSALRNTNAQISKVQEVGFFSNISALNICEASIQFFSYMKVPKSTHASTNTRDVKTHGRSLLTTKAKTKALEMHLGNLLPNYTLFNNYLEYNLYSFFSCVFIYLSKFQ